jgi:hypothetical protein
VSNVPGGQCPWPESGRGGVGLHIVIDAIPGEWWVLDELAPALTIACWARAAALNHNPIARGVTVLATTVALRKV